MILRNYDYCPPLFLFHISFYPQKALYNNYISMRSWVNGVTTLAMSAPLLLLQYFFLSINTNIFTSSRQFHKNPHSSKADTNRQRSQQQTTSSTFSNHVRVHTSSSRRASASLTSITAHTMIPETVKHATRREIQRGGTQRRITRHVSVNFPACLRVSVVRGHRT